MGTYLSIKALRNQAHRTQKEMADLFNISLDTWRKWERNPDAMPYSAHLQAVDFLEQSIQIRKDTTTMTRYMGELPVDRTPVDLTARADNDYTVPIPEGLTDEFEPSRPVTSKQMLDYDLHGKEPYPGYADEYEAWQEAWEQVNRAQLVADGGTLNIQDPIHAPAEFDEYGEPIEYANDPKAVVRDDGNIDLYTDKKEDDEE